MMNKTTTLLFIISMLGLLSSCGDDTYRLDNSSQLLGGEGQGGKRQMIEQVFPNGVRKSDYSTPAGNLITTALLEELDLDIALYPSDLINGENYAILTENPSERQIQDVLNTYPKTGNKDQFRTGLMRGRDIKKLLRTRILDNFKLDTEVGGMVYNVHVVAGVVQSENYGLINGRKFEDKETYRVAINQHFFFSGETFPSYRFRNGLNFSFVPDGRMFSAQEVLTNYLRKMTTLPFLKARRGTYSQFTLNSVGAKKTYEIQGNAHRSPYYGHKVTTSGIVTAIDNVDWYPRGVDIIIQDEKGDGIDQTSDALHIHIQGDVADVKVGQKITVSGTVYEHMTLDNTQNMSKTVIREVTNIDNSDKTIYPLPAPVLIGKEGRRIPNRVLSSYVGDLNYKQFLNLNDGIDFWESLEGMRVKIMNPRVAGFRGGNEELVRLNPQRHLSLYIVPDGFKRTTDRTGTGGITEDFMAGNFNPEVIHLSAGHLTNDFNRLNPSNPRNTRGCEQQGGILYTNASGEQKCRVPTGLVTTQYHYNIGDIFKGEVVGIISFESNLFGGGEYTFVLPEAIYRYDKDVNNGDDAICVVRSLEYLSEGYNEQFAGGIEGATCAEIIDVRQKNKSIPSVSGILRPAFKQKPGAQNLKMVNCLDVDFFKGSMPFECRPQTKLIGKDRDLTVAAYNLENLAGNQDDRIKTLGEAILNNLKCPDIISLVEIQDNNGLDFEGGSDASITLEKVIKATKCDKQNVVYKAVDVELVNHNEGGQPGGNIRVAMIYNSTRVSFTSWRPAIGGPLGDTSLQETRMTPEGNLTNNPGRVFPTAEAFENTRKSTVAQFEFFGEKVFVIGNHFNSKLGDSSFWGAQQPPFPKSDQERSLLAIGVNNFVQLIERYEPNANVVVLGDFNAYYNEFSMRTLGSGNVLTNLMFFGDLLPASERYTHNFNGNSGAIDFIFANRRLLGKKPQFEAIHINSDYMGRLSDHDPVIAKFSF